MRKSKGKWIFNYKETFGLDTTLRPIIGAGLVKFRDVLVEKEKSSKVFGVPSGFYDEETDRADKWFDVLDKMVYAFTAKEPDMRDFGVSLDMTSEPLPESHPNHKTCSKMVFIYTPSEEAYNVYRDAMREHEKKLQEGYKLFGENYQSLWW
jgi:hypothetical protein